MVEQIATARFDEPLGDSILPGASNGNSNRAHSKVLCGLHNVTLEGVLAIKYEKLRSGIVGEGLSKLLRYPGRSRMQCNVPVKNTPPIMSNHEEAIQHAELERRHGEEIHRCNGFAMVAQERRPTPGWRRASWSLPHPSKPSILSSPWIRGAPQVRFSATMRKISSRSSLHVGFLPTTACLREIHFQYSLNPVRCQRMTVSGWTSTNAFRHPCHTRRTATPNNRSDWENRD